MKVVTLDPFCRYEITRKTVFDISSSVERKIVNLVRDKAIIVEVPIRNELYYGICRFEIN